MHNNRRRIINWLLTVVILAALVTPFVAQRLEPHLVQPAAKFMTFVLTGRFSEHRIESNGVPSIYYRRLGDYYYNPVYASMYGLYYHSKAYGSSDSDIFLSHYNLEVPQDISPTEARLRFFAVADWLVENLILYSAEGLEYGVWEYEFDWPVYSLDAPWVSGMAQGVGIQVLLRAWADSGSHVYLETAESARNAFYISVQDGGVTYFDSDTSWWYEEYASPSAVESRVFNGAAHSVIALYEMAEWAEDSSALTLYTFGLNSLKSSLKDYDAGYWTYYDAFGLMANYKYHFVNIGLANRIYEITGDTAFKDAAEKWSSYTTPFFEREFIRQTPQYSDLLVLGFSYTLSFVPLGLIVVFVHRARLGKST